jgi:hypothetical protein
MVSTFVWSRVNSNGENDAVTIAIEYFSSRIQRMADRHKSFCGSCGPQPRSYSQELPCTVTFAVETEQTFNGPLVCGVSLLYKYLS